MGHGDKIERGTFLRFVKVGFVPASMSATLPPGALDPTSEDKRVAERNNEPVRVSVWDEDRCTVEQAREHLPPPKPEASAHLRPFKLDAEHLCTSAAEKAPDERVVQIVEDELPPELRKNAGAAAHSGVEGLDRGKSNRPTWRAWLDALATKCLSPYEEPPAKPGGVQ
jgi:hypothetical protein